MADDPRQSEQIRSSNEWNIKIAYKVAGEEKLGGWGQWMGSDSVFGLAFHAMWTETGTGTERQNDFSRPPTR